jgi:large subunit ribosomal protein L4e
MTSRPTVTVWKADGSASGSSPMPAVMSVPIRNDLVHFVHSNLAKNRRQGHAVFHKAGAEHSAESWGTGRAVARIPRISGSGTSRSGQATFGNMARKARMFAPLKIWRKWHAKCNITQRRHAVASALAASACTPLVMARGHSVENVTEFPLVVEGLNASEKTSELLNVLDKLGVSDDLSKVKSSKKIRTGVGKYRNSRYVMRKGPLLVYNDESNLAQAARNIQGVDVCNVHRLNVLQLAPGGHLGRFVIFTKSAFGALDTVFGDFVKASAEKKGYTLNRPTMECADLSRIINSDQVQTVLRDVKARHARVHDKTKKNPLINKALMHKLNPFAKKKQELLAAAAAKSNANRKAALKAKRSKDAKKAKKTRNATWNGLQDGLKQSFKAADDLLAEEERAGNYVPGDTSEEEEDD